MLEALKHNNTLQSFTLDCSGTDMSYESGLALAEAPKHNHMLQSFGGFVREGLPCVGCNKRHVRFVFVNT